MESKLERGHIFSVYSETLSFLHKSFNDYFYILDFETGKVKFFGDIAEKYDLPLDEDNCCSVDDWCAIVYPRDLEFFSEDIRQLKEGEKLLHNLEYRLRNRGGDVVWISCTGKILGDADSGLSWMIGRVSDSSWSTKVDALTGALLFDGLKAEADKILEEERVGYFLIIGIDDLKKINMKKGRYAGDEILCLAATAIETETCGTHNIYRVNGDCFAVNLPDYKRDEIEEVFRKIQDRLKGHCTVSGGCVPYREYHIPDSGSLCQYAENTLELSKAQGKNMLKFFSTADYEKELETLELKEELMEAIKDGFKGFAVHYQPQISPSDFTLFGAEALLRFYSPTRGLVSPVEFIPILEQSNLICPVGLWILERALYQCSIWRKTIPDFHISVNVSYTQLQDQNIAQYFLNAIARSGLPGDALTLEVTESMELHDYPEINKIFSRLKSIGVEISVDDFGTGYSSLSRLKELEIDEIKIDRCFVSDIQNSAYNYRLLSNMLEWAAKSKIRVCCEGVENSEELAVITQLRPQVLQGFLFSKPCSVEDFANLYIDEDSQFYQERLERDKVLKANALCYSGHSAHEWTEGEKFKAVLEAQTDVIYVSDLSSYELYYLNPAGQKLLGISSYRGQKCYQVLQGRNSPCPYCTNSRLSEDEFYIWERRNEMTNMHFMLKDKIIPWENKKARMEIAVNITEQTDLSDMVEEKLDFAENIVACSKILSSNLNVEEVTLNMLALIGNFYKADRAFLFEPDTEAYSTWTNTYEWCDVNIVPQKNMYQSLDAHHIANWLELFQQDRSVIILNFKDVKDKYPSEYALMGHTGIVRTILVPVIENSRLLCFVGVDNPCHCIQDDSQIRVLSSFLINRVRQEKNEFRLQNLLDFEYSNILSLINLGLWVIHIDRRTGQGEMLVDDTLRRIMGIQMVLTPEETYKFWFSRVKPECRQYVESCVEQIVETGATVQLEYTWSHPIRGDITVVCTGLRREITSEKITLSGYHRNLHDVLCPKLEG